MVSTKHVLLICLRVFYSSYRTPHSFPTRRSSDLYRAPVDELDQVGDRPSARRRRSGRGDLDRKSIRLNSSHLVISYAVFCLKKKFRNMNCTYKETEIKHHKDLNNRI